MTDQIGDKKTKTTQPSFLVFDRYVKYSLVGVKGWWALYQDEKLDPIFKHRTNWDIHKIRFDSCSEKEVKEKRDPKYIMVAVKPSKKIPFQWFSTENKSFKKLGEVTYYRLENSTIDVWLKGEKTQKGMDSSMFLSFVSKINPLEDSQCQVYITEDEVGIIDQNSMKQKMKLKSNFSGQLFHLQVRIKNTSPQKL